MKRIIHAIMFFCLALHAQAANVVWGSAFFVAEDGQWNGIWHDRLVGMGSPYLRLDLGFSGDSIILTAIPDSNLENANSFVTASIGDVVNAEYIDAHWSFFAYAKYDEWDSRRTDYALIFEPGDDYYLAFREERYDSTTYGWVQLGYTYDRELVVIGSAWDKDGDAIVVGAIPEPSGGLLLVLGIAALSLRRSRIPRCPENCVRSGKKTEFLV